MMVKKIFAYLLLVFSILFSSYFIYDTYRIVNDEAAPNYDERKEELIETDDRKLKMEISDYNYSVDVNSLFLKPVEVGKPISYLYAFESENVTCDDIEDDLFNLDSSVFRIGIEAIEDNKFKLKSVEMVVKDSLDNKFVLSSIPDIKETIEPSLENGEYVISLNLQWEKRYIIGKLPSQVCD